MDAKCNALLDELWVGKSSYECDGRLTDFSMLSYLWSAPIKKLHGQTIEFKSLLDNNFVADYGPKLKFSYQYKFRKDSIAFIFQKECISTAIVGILLIFLNMKYLTLFSVPRNFESYNINIKALSAGDNRTYFDQVSNKEKRLIKLDLVMH